MGFSNSDNTTFGTSGGTPIISYWQLHLCVIGSGSRDMFDAVSAYAGVYSYQYCD